MKLIAQVEGLGIKVIFAAILVRDAIVTITGDRTVNKAGADAIPFGRVVKPAKEVNGEGTVETRFKERITIKASGAIVAGDRVKMAAADGGGIQRVTKWISQTDAAAGDKPDTLFGVCLIGGADGADVDVLTY
ncbi:MAG TPA: hypothetical protein VGN95_21595 [Pyrinomonadaceae bacterium]|nr:hypothetical protein [Pyrinomonadaceae bacterium]